MARFGPVQVEECLEQPVDTQAPTPETFHMKERAAAESPFMLKRDDCTFITYGA